MNVFLWILQGLLALHTLVGAVWKFSSTAEQTMASFKVLPAGVWGALAVLEIFLSLDLVLPALVKPALVKPLSVVVPFAAIGIAVEMLFFSGLHLYAGDGSLGPVMYWMVVAAVSGFIAYGRLVLKPLS